MSTSIQNLKRLFSPPSFHRIGKEGFKRSALHSATQLNFCCLTWSTHIISWGLVHTVPWMTLLNYFAIAKCKYLRKPRTQPSMSWEHPPTEISPYHYLLLIRILHDSVLCSNTHAVDQRVWPLRDTLPFLASVGPVVSQHLCKLKLETNTLNCIAA